MDSSDENELCEFYLTVYSISQFSIQCLHFGSNFPSQCNINFPFQFPMLNTTFSFQFSFQPIPTPHDFLFDFFFQATARGVVTWTMEDVNTPATTSVEGGVSVPVVMVTCLTLLISCHVMVSMCIITKPFTNQHHSIIQYSVDI